MKTRVLFSLKSMVITALVLMLTTSMAWAQDVIVKYLDPTAAMGAQRKTVTNPVLITNSTTAIGSAGDETWYYVSGTVTNSNRIEVSGTVNLILEDGCSFTLSNGIHVPSSSALNIYAQSVANCGSLTASASGYNAAIGGNGGEDLAQEGGYGENSGNITIYGGNIITTGNIGGGNGGRGLFYEQFTYGGNGGDGNVTIYSGIITVNNINYNGNNDAYSSIGGGLPGVGQSASGWDDPAYFGQQGGGTVNLSWAHSSDRFYSSHYNGTVTLEKSFVDNDGNAVTSSSVSGKTIKPDGTLYTVSVSNSLPTGVTATVDLPLNEGNKYAVNGQVVTFSYTNNGVAAGYLLVFTVNYTDADGDQTVGVTDNGDGTFSFVMPAADVTITAVLKKDIATCTATVPDQTMKAYNSVYHYVMDWDNIIYKFEAANYPEYNGYFVGEVVKDGNDSLTLITDYKFGSVVTLTGDGSHSGDQCKVEIVGQGDYAGSKWVNFTIISESASGTWNNGDLSWNLSDGALSITLTNPEGGNKAMDKAANRESYPWHPYGSYITSITIGNGITSIADNAFAGTYNVITYGGVTSVTLPSSLNTIGDYAFAYCSGATFNLDNIFKNTQVTIDSIGTSAFNQVGKLVSALSATADNTGLVSILVQTTNADVTFDGLTFYKDGTWNTLCLPFDLELTGTFLEGCTLMELDVDGYYNNEGNLWPGNISYDGYHQTSLADDGTLYLNFKVATRIEAGKPYLIKWASGESVVNPTFSGVNIASTTTSNVTSGDGKAIFKGTYRAVTSSIEEISLVENHDNATNAFHAFFTIKKMGNALTEITPNNKLRDANAMAYTTTWTANPTASATAWTSNGGWRFIASPIEANIAIAEVENLIDATPGNYDLYRLNPKTTTWENYKAVDANDNQLHTDFTQMVNGKGYLYASASAVTLRYTGTPYNNSTKEVDLEQGYNLVGNPFATNATLDKSYYMLDEQGTTIMPNAVSGSTAIAPCTGVIVQSTVENEKVTFTKVAPQASAPNNGNLSISLTQTVATRSGNKVETLDKAIVSFNEGSELGKFYFGEQDANLYIPQDGKEYAIAYSDMQGEMPLNFKAKKNGEYTLTISAPLTSHLSSLTLIDNLTGVDIDLLATPTYTFTARKDDYASRFRLVFSANENDNGNEDFAFISDGDIIINGAGTLQVIDLLGRQLFTCEANSEFRIPNSAFPAGVYVLRLINGENVKTQKIVIRH